MENPDKTNHKRRNSKTSKIANNQTSFLLSLLQEKNTDKLDESTANKLIKSGNIDLLAKTLSKFERLSNDIAKELIKKGYTESLAKNLSSFQGLDKNIAKIIIQDRYGSFKYSLSSFTKLDNQIAYILINKKDYNELAHHIYSFEHLNNDILIILLVNCTKYQHILLKYRSVFEGGEPNDNLLNNLKLKGEVIEYKKLKDFYEMIEFEKTKENFESQHRFEESFNIKDAKDAIKYRKGKYVIKFLEKFIGDFRELINLLIEGGYINELKNNLSKLWGQDIDWYELIYQFALTNDYNVLVKNANHFKKEGISNIEIADEIIRNCDLDCRDSVKQLSDYSDDEEWEWINYNLDFCKIVMKGQKSEFFDLMEYFKKDFSSLPINRNLPLKLKDAVKEKFGLNALIEYKDLFE